MRIEPERWAEIYDAPARSGQRAVFRRTAEVARAACLKVAMPGERWADVGCGTGHLAAELAAAGLDVVGLDLDPRMVAFARERFGDGGGLRFGTAPAERLPFADGALDGIVATSLAGLLADLEAFLREARRALRAGGSLVVTFTNRWSAVHAARLVARTLRPRPPSALDTPVRLFSPRDAMRALGRAGLAAVDVRFYNYPLAATRLAGSLEHAAGRRTGFLVARNFVVVARRPAAVSA